MDDSQGELLEDFWNQFPEGSQKEDVQDSQKKHLEVTFEDFLEISSG